MAYELGTPGKGTWNSGTLLMHLAIPNPVQTVHFCFVVGCNEGDSEKQRLSNQLKAEKVLVGQVSDHSRRERRELTGC